MNDTTPNPLLDEARQLITDASLSPEDKTMLLLRISAVSDAVLDMFITTCKADPAHLHMIAASLTRKLDTKGDLGKLHAIAKAERKAVEDLVFAAQ